MLATTDIRSEPKHYLEAPKEAKQKLMAITHFTVTGSPNSRKLSYSIKQKDPYYQFTENGKPIPDPYLNHTTRSPLKLIFKTKNVEQALLIDVVNNGKNTLTIGGFIPDDILILINNSKIKLNKFHSFEYSSKLASFVKEIDVLILKKEDTQTAPTSKTNTTPKPHKENLQSLYESYLN